MHKFRTILSVVATAAMVLGTMGAASAAGTTNMTRADFIVQLDQTLGIQPVSPTTPNFTDVATTDANYGYIEAAYQKGFINGISGDASKGTGVFGPTLPITRAQAAKVLVEAYEGGNYTPTQTSTTFTDNTSIPSALVGFVAEASTLKLMQGFTSGSFGPNAYLTTAQENHLIAQLQAVMASAAFKVSASSTDVGVGQIVTLSSTGSGTTTYAVTGANASSALLSGSSFVASAAGNYTVTGTNAGNTASVTIGVYGTATALSISAPKTVVANGASQTNVTVSVVDANGNVVGSNTDWISLTSSNQYAATVGTANAAPTSSSTTANIEAVNGVATFVLQSGTVPGASATLTATDTTSGTAVANPTSTDYQATVADTAQTATSLSVSGDQYVAANQAGTTSTVDVQVLDQSGEPMVYGTFPFSVSISGPAQFSDGTTTSHSYVYNGNSSAGNAAAVASFSIEDVQGETGAITVTASGTNLTSGSATITAVISGSPAAIQLTAPTTTSFSEDSASTGLQYGLQVVDSHGYPVSDGFTADVAVTTGGNTADNIKVNGTAPTGSATFVQVPVTGGSATLTLTDAGVAADAGSYAVQVSDDAGNLTASSSNTFSITAGAPKYLTLSGASYIAAANPTDTISAQVTDAYGNDVAIAGVPVVFTASSNATPSSTTVNTNAQGVATVTETVPPYTGGSGYTVSAQGTYNSASANLFVKGGTPFAFTVESTVATGVQVTLKNTGTSQYGTAGASNIAQAGDTVQVSVYADDQYGNPVQTADAITVTLTGPSSSAYGLSNPGTATYGTVKDNHDGTWTVTMTKNASGNYQALFTALADAAGNTSVAAQDTSAPGEPTGSTMLSVVAGPLTGFGFTDSSGNAASNESVTANTPITLTLSGTDFFGNMAVPQSVYYVGLQATGVSGGFRTSTTSSDVTSVAVSAGSTGVPVYYVPSADSTSAAFTAPAYVDYTGAATSPTFYAYDSTGAALSGSWTVNGGAPTTGTTFSPTGSAGTTVTIGYTSGTTTISFSYTY